jgi:hypothetical protein
MRDCTFHPKLNTKSLRSSSKYKEKENIIEDIELMNKRREIETKQIKMY